MDCDYHADQNKYNKTPPFSSLFVLFPMYMLGSKRTSDQNNKQERHNRNQSMEGSNISLFHQSVSTVLSSSIRVVWEVLWLQIVDVDQSVESNNVSPDDVVLLVVVDWSVGCGSHADQNKYNRNRSVVERNVSSRLIVSVLSTLVHGSVQCRRWSECGK